MHQLTLQYMEGKSRLTGVLRRARRRRSELMTRFSPVFSTRLSTSHFLLVCFRLSTGVVQQPGMVQTLSFNSEASLLGRQTGPQGLCSRADRLDGASALHEG